MSSLDTTAKKTNLLILRGVYPKDFASNVIHDNILTASKLVDTIIVPTAYTEIPKKFVTVDAWPQFSNLKCWECDQLPTTFPKFIPMNPEKDKDGNDICDVHGHFCEWNCAVRYVTKEFPKDQQWDALQAICLFESKFSGIRRVKIVAAISKTCMKQYCGNSGMTSKQFREVNTKLDSDYSISNHKLINYSIDE